MTPGEVATAKTESLIGAYRVAASEHGSATDDADFATANRAADVVATIYGELRRRGSKHQSQLLPLLSDTSTGVRLWSASHALEFAAPQGETVLAELSLAKTAIGFSAETTLAEWRAGRLRFPK